MENENSDKLIKAKSPQNSDVESLLNKVIMEFETELGEFDAELNMRERSIQDHQSNTDKFGKLFFAVRHKYASESRANFEQLAYDFLRQILSKKAPGDFNLAHSIYQSLGELFQERQDASGYTSLLIHYNRRKAKEFFMIELQKKAEGISLKDQLQMLNKMIAGPKDCMGLTALDRFEFLRDAVIETKSNVENEIRLEQGIPDKNDNIEKETNEPIQNGTDDTYRAKVLLLTLLIFNRLDIPEIAESGIITFFHSILGGDRKSISKAVKNASKYMDNNTQSLSNFHKNLEFVRTKLTELEWLNITDLSDKKAKIESEIQIIGEILRPDDE